MKYGTIETQAKQNKPQCFALQHSPGYPTESSVELPDTREA